MAGRTGREKKRAADFAAQEKALKQAMAKGVGKKAATKKVLGQLNLKTLREAPKEYRVK